MDVTAPHDCITYCVCVHDTLGYMNISQSSLCECARGFSSAAQRKTQNGPYFDKEQWQESFLPWKWQNE